VIEELARPTAMAHMIQDEHLEDPSAFFRGLLLAIAVTCRSGALSYWR